MDPNQWHNIEYDLVKLGGWDKTQCEEFVENQKREVRKICFHEISIYNFILNGLKNSYVILKNVMGQWAKNFNINQWQQKNQEDEGNYF